MPVKDDLRVAALGYLSEWMSTDEPLRRRLLSAIQSQSDGEESGAKVISDFASIYGVSRTLKGNGEQPRLLGAYKALCEVQALSADNLNCEVARFAGRLKAMYKATADSAATKFLWLRFRGAVKIYDSLAWRWLCKQEQLRGQEAVLRNACGEIGVWYPLYRVAWEREYALLRGQIENVGQELAVLGYMTSQRDADSEHLEEWVTSEWFLERVFDRYMIGQSE